MGDRQAGQWAALVAKSFELRHPVEHFAALAAALSRKNVRVPGNNILKTLLKLQGSTTSGIDPLVPQYVEFFLSQRWLEEPDLLQVLLEPFGTRLKNNTTSSAHDAQNSSDSALTVSPQLEDTLFTLAVNRLISEQKPATTKESHRIIKAMITWLEFVTSPDSGALLNLQHFAHETMNLLLTLSVLVISMLNNEKIRASLEAISDLKKPLGEAVAAFTPILAQLAPPLAQRLDFDAHILSTAQSNSDMKSKLSIAELNMSSAADNQPSMTRAGLLVFLEAVLTGWPTLDDNSFLTFLNIRNKGDIEASIVELVTTTFEIYTLAMNRGDPPNNLSIFRMFLSEKLPLLILSLSSMTFVPIEVSLILPQPLQRLPWENLRQQFLFACVLHGIIIEDQVETLLGSKPSLALPKSGKLTKDILIQEYRRDVSQAERFVERLEARDGNASAYTETLVEIMQHLSISRDTMALRGICNALAGRPTAVTAIALFTSSARFLSPLCQVLDNWRHEDDHSEYQPVYDEFGACFLLVTTCIARFDLKAGDLGPIQSDGFVARVVNDTIALALFPKELSPDDNKHLTTWIQGLFETEGISDELMSACPPQDFYRLVPTIFSQSIIAARSSLLPMDKLRNGFELLLEPFLLPSIILGIRSIIQHLWERQGDAIIIMEILQKLLIPSNTTSKILTTVLSIIAQPLERALIDLKQSQTPSPEVGDRLLQQLQPSLQRFRISRPQALGVMAESAGVHEAPPNASLATFRQDFESICSWSLTDGASGNVTYSNRRTTSIIQRRGAPDALHALIDEIQHSMQSPLLGETALDIATAIVCAPYRLSNSPSTANALLGTTRLTMQRALQLELQDMGKLSHTDPIRAQLLTRLSRRVEVQLSSMPHPVSSTDLQNVTMPMMLDVAVELERPLAEQIVLPPEHNLQLDSSLNFTTDDNEFHLDIDAALASQNTGLGGFPGVPQSADDDIFAGLAFDTEMDFE